MMELREKLTYGSSSSTNIKSRNSLPTKRRIIAWNSTPPEDGMHEYPVKELNLQRPRPASAPVRSYPSQSSGRKRRQKPLYKQTSKVVCVRAFVNGDQEKYARVTAPDLKQLLEECTAKLGLVSAARKLYLSDGTLIKVFSQIKKSPDVHVSCGEAFKDPFGKYKEKEKLGRLSTWTMNGIVLPESKTRGKTKPSLSDRMKVLVEKQKRRVLVFPNGDYTNGKEVVAGRFDEFLDDCTQKLSFESGARALYDWDGKEIGNFSEVPVVDDVIQPTTNTLLGPLWATRGGEKFSFKGPCGFVGMLLETTKERFKDAKDYENQLELRLNGSEEAISVEVMSFTEKEIEKELEQVRNRISDLQSVIPKLKSRKKRLQQKKREEEINCTNDSSFKFQNITEIEENSRLLGKKGIRLKVYENGKIDDEVIVYFNIHEASKGILNDNYALLGRLLDAITAHQKVLKQGHGPAGRPVARRIYRDNGKEVLNVHELRTDDSIWLSFGEDFKQPYTYALQLVLDKTKPISLWNEKKIIQRETLNDDLCGKERASLWTAVHSYPSDCNYQDVNFDMEPRERIAFAQSLQPSRINDQNTFVQYQKNPDLILYPEISVEKKLAKGDIVWPSECQTWAINKSGLIYSRAFPQLCLSTTNLKLKVNYQEETTLEGFVVQLRKRNVSSASQLFSFTPSGDICSVANPSLLLSWIANENFRLINENEQEEYDAGSLKEPDGIPESDEKERPETVSDNGLTAVKDVYSGERYCVAVLPKLPVKHQSIGTQRWALKQESLNNIGQWKYSKVSNPEWNRRALSWPVKQDGTRNEDFKWPMAGFLICNAPPTRRSKGVRIGPPVRLQVLKNGENDVERAVTVIGPDLSNMARDISGKETAQGKKSIKSLSSSFGRLDISNLELNLFLDRCTEALQLPFAARRLFDESGTELFSLADVQRDQRVYVSCGETWVNFKTSYSEQQRRAIMTNLASDVARLRQFCRLRNPDDLILMIDGSMVAGSPVCLAHCGLTQEEIGNCQKDSEDIHNGIHDSESDKSLEGVRNDLLSSHERAHIKAEERLKTLQWPWETALTTHGEFSLEYNDYAGDLNPEVSYSDRHLNKRYRHHSVKHHSGKDSELLPYQWLCKDGFIHLRRNNQLVLGISNDSSEDKPVNKVTLCKKKLDEPHQRWTIADDGTIHLRSNSSLLLTVADPRLNCAKIPQDSCVGYECCTVLVMPRKPVNGNANQIWSYDPNSGFLLAFTTDSVNKEITAANKAGICTYAVMGSKKVQQVGYVQQDDSTKMFLCEACGRVSRGKFRLQKLEQSQIFSCALGEADKKDKSGCFKCLSNKVDITTDEAEATLGMWEEELKRLKKVTSVRTLNKEILAAQSVPAVRIRAYKNGEGSRYEPTLVIGASIDSLLAQCTGRLGLVTAARRLYTIDGELITDVNQLRDISWQDSGNTSQSNKVDKLKNNSNEKPAQHKDDPVEMVYTANQREAIEDEHNESEKVPTSSLSLSPNNDNRCSNRQATDVFVSCGEHFVPLQEVDRQYFLQRKHQNQRTWVETHLETEKHVLRHMQGRRISARISSDVLPGPTVSSSLQDLTRLEENKQENIDELKGHLNDLKSKQQQEKEKFAKPNSQNRISSNKKLYNGVKNVRIDIYENGDTEQRGVSVCGSSLLEILNHSTSRLGLCAAARRIFTRTGQEVHDVLDLIKGESYCVSCGENFIQARDSQRTVQRKATWSRLNRLTGGSMAYKTNEGTQNAMLALTAGPQKQLTYH